MKTTQSGESPHSSTLVLPILQLASVELPKENGLDTKQLQQALRVLVDLSPANSDQIVRVDYTSDPDGQLIKFEYALQGNSTKPNANNKRSLAKDDF